MFAGWGFPGAACSRYSNPLFYLLYYNLLYYKRIWSEKVSLNPNPTSNPDHGGRREGRPNNEREAKIIVQVAVTGQRSDRYHT
jgi:hypothetical protein